MWLLNLVIINCGLQVMGDLKGAICQKNRVSFPTRHKMRLWVSQLVKNWCFGTAVGLYYNSKASVLDELGIRLDNQIVMWLLG